MGFAAGDNNLFRYCGNDPLDRTDPDGMMSISAWAPAGWDRSYADVRDEEIRRLDAGITMAPISAQVEGPKNDNAGFFGAVRQFTGAMRPDGSRVDPREIGRVLVADAREAAVETADNLRRSSNKSGQIYGVERVTARYVNGKNLMKSGPVMGVDAQYSPHGFLPGPPKGLAGKPFTGSHSHGPQSPRGFAGDDIRSANGAFGARYISSVGSSVDRGAAISIYVPGPGRGFFHSTDGENFFLGR